MESARLALGACIAFGARVPPYSLDEPEAVRTYVKEMGIDYPILLASMSDFGLMRAYGNDRDALPFTVIVDAQGRLHTRKLGEYHENDLRADIEAALAN